MEYQQFFMKKSLSVILPKLVYIFDRIISNGIWSSLWRTSIMVLLYKGQSPKILDSRLNDWLEGFEVMKEEQGGFRKGYSTTDKVFILSGLTEKYGSVKNKLNIAFMDLRKLYVNTVLLKKA